jgi:hypothetical protein
MWEMHGARSTIRLQHRTMATTSSHLLLERQRACFNGHILDVERKKQSVRAFVYDNIHNNYIMSRGATMLKLSANAVVTFKSNAAGNYGSTDGLINAQGFLYSPLGGAAAAVAWGVRNPTASGFAKGPVTVVPFTTINVNLQGVWNTTTNTVTIPVAGTYFIDLTAVLYGSASGWHEWEQRYT